MAPWTSTLLSLLSFIAVTHAQYNYFYGGRNDMCTNPTGLRGRCVSIQQCDALLSILRKQPLLPEDAQFLRQSQCGFENRIPKVCCPKSQPVIPELTTSRPQNTNNGGYRPPAWGANDNTPPRPEAQTLSWESHPNARLLPMDTCGIDNGFRIWGGNITELDEYPWAVLLQYQSSTGMKRFMCGGSLISKRYVVTAAHCLSRANLNGWALIMVRVGEFDTERNPDCEKDLVTGKDVCAPPPQDIGIERIIIHTQYNPRNDNRFNDIGLIRLNKDAEFSDYVKAICLPFDDTARDRYLGEELIAAGWGKTEKMTSSTLKMKVRLPVVTTENCGEVYKSKNIVVGDTQICAGGEEGRDSCTGDSGGPLMNGGISSRDGKTRIYLAGLVSYGPDACGKKNWPGVYTRLSHFTNWILNQIAN